MPYVTSLQLTAEEAKQLVELVKHANHWRERQRAQTILWLSQGKKVAEVAELHNVIPETIRQHRRLWIKLKFEAIKEGHRSGRICLLNEIHHQQILVWVQTESLNAVQIKQRLHAQFALTVSVDTIRNFLKKSDLSYTKKSHSMKKQQVLKVISKPR